jgi:hypothetical protein
VTKNFQLVRNFGGFLEACQNPANQTAIIYDNGSLQPTNTYTISNGLVQFTNAPAAGHSITADFTFLHRVRFDAGTSRGSSSSGTREGIEFSNFYFNLYECKEVQLISVRK